MRKTTITLLSLFALIFSLAAWGAADESASTGEADSTLQLRAEGAGAEEVEAIDDAGDTFRYLSDATGEGDCDADAEEGCAAPVVCPCTCNGVAYPITIDPARHGETCAQVNGRPCTNDGVNWFTLKNC